MQRAVVYNNSFSVTNLRRDCISLEPFSFQETGRPTQNDLAEKKKKKKRRLLAHVPEKSRIQVWLDQRHKECHQDHLLVLPFTVLASFSVYKWLFPGLWGKRAGLFPGHLYLMLLFEAHEFCTWIGLDWVTGPLLKSGMETSLLKSTGI